MVYHFPPNSSAGITNGHLSLVTPPQHHHQDSNEATPTSMQEGGWQSASAWIPTTACSNTNIMDNQHYNAMNSGFASPSEAELALAGQGN